MQSGGDGTNDPDLPRPNVYAKSLSSALLELEIEIENDPSLEEAS
jgi:hypothetical protein